MPLTRKRLTSLELLRDPRSARRQQAAPAAAVTPGQEAASSPAGAAAAAVSPPAVASEGLHPTLPPGAGQVRSPQANAPRPVDSVRGTDRLSGCRRGMSWRLRSVDSRMARRTRRRSRAWGVRCSTRRSRAAAAPDAGRHRQPRRILRITSVVDDRAQNFHARQSPDGSRDRVRLGSRRRTRRLHRRLGRPQRAAHQRRRLRRHPELVTRRQDDRVRSRRGRSSEGLEPVDRGRRLRSRPPAHVLPLRRSLGWLVVS